MFALGDKIFEKRYYRHHSMSAILAYSQNIWYAFITHDGHKYQTFLIYYSNTFQWNIYNVWSKTYSTFSKLTSKIGMFKQQASMRESKKRRRKILS